MPLRRRPSRAGIRLALRSWGESKPTRGVLRHRERCRAVHLSRSFAESWCGSVLDNSDHFYRTSTECGRSSVEGGRVDRDPVRASGTTASESNGEHDKQDRQSASETAATDDEVLQLRHGYELQRVRTVSAALGHTVTRKCPQVRSFLVDEEQIAESRSARRCDDPARRVRRCGRRPGSSCASPCPSVGWSSPRPPATRRRDPKPVRP
jgi:hypothetical protein